MANLAGVVLAFPFLLQTKQKLERAQCVHVCVCVCVCKSSSVRNNLVLRVGRQTEEEEKECAANDRIWALAAHSSPSSSSVVCLSSLGCLRPELDLHTQTHTHTHTHTRTHTLSFCLLIAEETQKPEQSLPDLRIQLASAPPILFHFLLLVLFSQKMNETQHTFPLSVTALILVENELNQTQHDEQ